MVEAGVVARLAHRPDGTCPRRRRSPPPWRRRAWRAGPPPGRPRRWRPRRTPSRRPWACRCAVMPYQAVKLGMPSTPRWADSGAIAGSILRRPLPSWTRVGRPVQHADHGVALGELRIAATPPPRRPSRRSAAGRARRAACRSAARSCAGACRDRATGSASAPAPGRRPAPAGVTLSSRKQSGGDVARRTLGEHDLGGVGHGSFLSTKSLRR